MAPAPAPAARNRPSRRPARPRPCAGAPRPLVRRIAGEHGGTLPPCPGPGSTPRDQDDILSYVQASKATRRRRPVAGPKRLRSVWRPSRRPRATARPRSPAPPRPIRAFTGEELREPMSVMRQKIAEHMVPRAGTSPHVNTVCSRRTCRGSSLCGRGAHGVRGEARTEAHLHAVLSAAVMESQEFPSPTRLSTAMRSSTTATSTSVSRWPSRTG